MNMSSVPVVDINRLASSETLEALDYACREWGFFQVVNHGIPRDVVEAVFGEARNFFHQPMAVKRTIVRTKETPFGFYDRELTKNVRDLKQVYDYGPEYDGVIRPQWPAGMSGFKNAVIAHYRHCEQLGHRLLTAISTNLGMAPGYMSSLFGANHSSFLRLNYYPLSPGAGSRGSLGVGQHTDAGALTLLVQDGQPGLEVFHGGGWHVVEPLKDAVVINIGDIVQVWSNDRYRAALHRVLASVDRERFSIPFFMNPAYRVNYAPLPATVSRERPARYREINWGEFRKLRADGDYADYGEEVQISQYRIA